MTQKEKYINRVIIHIALSLLAWIFINKFIFEISLSSYIIIEIIIGVGDFFSNFIRKFYGLDTKKSRNNKTNI